MNLEYSLRKTTTFLEYVTMETDRIQGVLIFVSIRMDIKTIIINNSNDFFCENYQNICLRYKNFAFIIF
jgi:hypothetical protein